MTQQQITSTWQSSEIKVSVICCTYNHENYIRDALNGFLIQKTTFPFEVLINEDASTDNTAKILKEYEEKYPQVIKPIYHDVNEYSQGIDIFGNVAKLAKGKYIAICEGDDYWIDENKLQMQVDFLEGNPEYGMCFSNTKILENNIVKDFLEPGITFDRDVETDEIILNGGMFIPTPSILFKRDFIVSNYPDCCKKCWVGDYPLQIYCSLQAKVFAFSTPFVVYRRNSAGSWTSKTSGSDFYKKKKGIESELCMLNGLNKLSDYNFNKIFLHRKIKFLGRNVFRELKLVLEGRFFNIFLFPFYLFLCFFRK